MKYFVFNYAVYNEDKILNEGECLYYTSAETNLDEMKDLVKENIIESYTNTIIKSIVEIDRESFIKKGGNQNIK
jgi:hypothetical protein